MRARRDLCAVGMLLFVAAASPTGSVLCRNTTGMRDGLFHTFWKDGGEACMTLAAGGRYAVRYRLGAGENLVVGRGWRKGSVDRRVRYRAAAFEPGRNSYLALYGWSTDPLVEYYIVENWGEDFTPPGPAAKAIGTVASDGGTYAIYRTRRIEQPSIRGRESFDQYWSVRTAKRPSGGAVTISVANHVAAWRALGMRLGRLDYQVLATEGFGSSGASDVTVVPD